MNRLVTTRTAGRGLALAIVAALLAGLWFALVDPVAGWLAEQQDTAAQSLNLLAAYRRTAVARPALAAELQRLRRQETALPGLVDGPTATVAAAGLQSRIRSLIETHGGEIRSVQGLPATTSDSFERIGLRYDLVATMAAAADILYQLETGTPYLFLDALTIHAGETWLPEGAETREVKLTLRFDVFGYRRAGKP